MDDRVSFLKLMLTDKIQSLIQIVYKDIDKFFDTFHKQSNFNYDELFSIIRSVEYAVDAYDEMRSCKK